MDLFHHVSQLKGLISIRLTMASAYGTLFRAPSRCFAKLTSLRHLVLEAPLLRVVSVSPAPEAAVVKLDSLKITTKPHQHIRILENIHFNGLRKLVLEFTRTTSASSLYPTIKSYLKKCSELESCSIAFIPGTPEEDNAGRSVKSKRTLGKQTHADTIAVMQRTTNLKQVIMLNVPPLLRDSTAYVLRCALPCWPQLTTLVFNVHEEPISSNTESEEVLYGPSGLYFLGATIWKSCARLEELEFHFDEAEIAKEKLLDSEVFGHGGCPSSGDDHPLRILTINTTSSRLDLDLRRKIEIATFLDRLFPRLDRLQGSASGVWEEVEMLIGSYQAVKEHVYARIEAL
ncbi:hypothetical protein H1R20_g13628, partial [Candolleomyces eurysporus]